MIEVKPAEFQAPFSLRLATYHDLPSIARLFVEAFGAHPVASLSLPLRHKFISAHVAERITLVAVDLATDSAIGFAIGGAHEQLDRARQAFIHSNVVPLALHALVRRSTLLDRAHLRLPGRASRSQRASPGAGHELRYLAVAAGARGCGIGSALLRAFEAEMLLVDQPYFVWVLGERAAAMQFYVHHGFREEYQIDGHVRMIKGRRTPLRF